MKEVSCYNCTHTLVCQYCPTLAWTRHAPAFPYKNDNAIAPHLAIISKVYAQACKHYEEQEGE